MMNKKTMFSKKIFVLLSVLAASTGNAAFDLKTARQNLLVADTVGMIPYLKENLPHYESYNQGLIAACKAKDKHTAHRILQEQQKAYKTETALVPDAILSFYDINEIPPFLKQVDEHVSKGQWKQALLKAKYIQSATRYVTGAVAGGKQ